MYFNKIAQILKEMSTQVPNNRYSILYYIFLLYIYYILLYMIYLLYVRKMYLLIIYSI